ncbi:MAG: lipoyl(octanoyl) transferase LipB [Bacteroidales bacterium]
MRRTEFIDLGIASYHKVWKYQEELLAEIQEKKKKGETFKNYLLFVEHPPVFTLGRNANESNLLISRSQLAEDKIEVFKINRGGDITFHGPGQLVVYPIIDMQSFQMGVKDYVTALEQVVIDTLKQYGISGERLPKATGVWVEPESKDARKICAIGVRCSQYVTMHGFALNGNTDLTYFRRINPCGFIDKGVTSIQKEQGAKPIDLYLLKDRVKEAFEQNFGVEWV